MYSLKYDQHIQMYNIIRVYFAQLVSFLGGQLLLFLCFLQQTSNLRKLLTIPLTYLH